ncbi:MAG: histidinol-phosphate aminotransferase family protein [Chloroflexota bacterium]|nr:histidinol-phosphate aminotransferase family protein [Chloroflexota bacterium]MDE3193770.1 histidinol-phosphate aminotransferase family protein [Chloroflexota bacterium]
MSDVLPQARPDLTGFAPYRTQQMAADVRLQANEWADPNPAARYLSDDELEALLLNRYPTAARDLLDALARRYGVGPDQIVVGNGSNEVLLYTFLLFGGHGRKTLLFQPTYSMHARLTQTAGGSVIDELVGLPYSLPAERALAAVERHRPEIVVICSPNNPSGTLVGEDVILSVARAVPRSLVLVDEAYADFAGFTVVPRIAEHPNLVVTKTFSKARAAAGLRLGILLAHPKVADMYRGVQLPYNLSSITAAVGAKIARDDAAIRGRVERNRTERERVHAALRRVSSIEAFPSETNFILFRLRAGTTEEVHARFLRESVLLRDLSSWPGCAGCLRVSIGTPDENDRFIAALRSVFGAAVAA